MAFRKLLKSGLALGGVAGSAMYLSTTAFAKADYKAIRTDIANLVDDDPDLGPTLVRLAWHASGTYCKNTNTGGSDGAGMRFDPERSWGANNGLGIARDALEPIKKKFPEITYSDLWTLSAVVAIEQMGGPVISWRPGRTDLSQITAPLPNGRLPDADKGKIGDTIRHVRDIFGRMGFNDKEMVCLIGAHALGRTNTQNSGYTGPWTRSPTTFSNQFFLELLNNEWTLKKWNGPDQFEDPTGELMMLPADLALVWDKEFRKHVKAYAANEQAFFKDFATVFQKLEELGTKKLGSPA